MTPTFPQDIVARIKEETDIVSVVRSYVTLRPAGAGFKGLCPFHREKTPSFNVTPSLNIYKCFGCGEGGDVISFLMKIEGISFPEALETLARPLDIDLSRFLQEDESEGERVAFHRANEVAARIWQQALWDEKHGQRAQQYLRERGFGNEVLRRFEVGFAPSGSEWFFRTLNHEGVQPELALRSGLARTGEEGRPFAYFRNRIIFPIKNIAQRVAGFGGRIFDRGEPKYLNSSDSTYFSKGKLLYGFSASRMSIARLKTAVLVEGYLDLLALAQAGFGNAVATCGTAFTPDQAKLIRRGCRTVVVLFDGDRAGLQAAVRASHVALAAGMEPKVARLPEGEDPASLLNSRDRSALAEILAGAVGYLPFLLSLIEERGGGREGKERALKQALGSISLVEDPIRQEYLLQEAAELYGIRLEILREHLAKAALASTRQPAFHQKPVIPSEDLRTSPKAGNGKRPVRSLVAVNRPRIEATLLAHALRDRSGEAADLLVVEASAEQLTTPEAELLRQELVQWHAAAQTGKSTTPAQFVQDRWHDKGAAYREYVSDLLTKEVVPDQTDFRRVILDCLARLQADRQRRQRLRESS